MMYQVIIAHKETKVGIIVDEYGKNVFPELFDDATKCRLSKDSPFFSRTSNIFLPTFPVAPTIAISMM